MKKILSFFIVLILTISSLTACNQNKVNTVEKENTANAENDKISIVTTIFPQYDFARQIVGDKADITMLLAPGVESHSYEPTPQDIIKIQNSDVFIYVGGESDEWVKEILESMDTSKMAVINLMDCVDVVKEETVEGMEAEEGEEEAEGKVEYDEHIWTSPKNAILISEKIAEELSKIDNKNSDLYKRNAESYVDKLKQLDADFQGVVDNAKRKTIAFGDRFPFRYFADAYGLTYTAAFPGCSTDTEPSASTIAYIIDKVKTEKLPIVYYIEFSNHKVADTISEATGAKTLLFHSCHNISKEDLASGITYLELMKKNVGNLKEALN